MNETQARQTKSCECAIAFALPRTRRQFVDDLRAGFRKDFAVHLTERDPDRVLKADTYASFWYATNNGTFGLEDAIDDMLTSVRAAHVTVVEDAELADFAQLFHEHTVVTLVSHWKPDVVFIDDVIDWPALARKLVPTADGILGWVARQLPPSAYAILREAASEAPLRQRQEEFVKELNPILRSSRFTAQEPVGHRLPGPEILNGFHNRNRLDAALTRELRPGNRAEFREGLYPAETVAACIPESFTGTLDLTLCNSVFLAESIKGCLGRRGSIVLANRDPTPLKLRMLLYKHQIRQVVSTQGDYRDTARQFRSLLLFGRPFKMPSLKEVLAEATSARDPMLGGKGEKEKLRTALQAVRARNERYFVVLIVVLIVFFIASWVLVFLNRSEPATLTTVFGALGGTVFGSIWMMVRLWRRKVATDIILAMLDDLPAAERKIVMTKILDML